VTNGKKFHRLRIEVNPEAAGKKYDVLRNELNEDFHRSLQLLRPSLL
jgi:hypothetical protein